MAGLRLLAVLVVGLGSVRAQFEIEIIEPNLNYPRPPDTQFSYPSPNATGIGGWDVAIAKARRFVDRLTVEEKVSICTGAYFPPIKDDDKNICQGAIAAIERVNFTGLCYADSNSGVGNSHSYSTGFPGGVTVASTWNREMMRARGFAIAQEFKLKGVHSVLGPVLALPRTVGGGTNFEGYGADPFLVGVAGYENILGTQGAGVQAEPKQYLGYDGQNYKRSFYSSNIDDKTFHETVLWPFAEAVRAGAACVMTSYPYVNNSLASQNAYLLNDVLKTHLGFQGYTQSDWGGIKSGVATVLAGMDQDMPGVAQTKAPYWSYFGANYTEAVRNGSVPEWRLNDAAVRILTPYYLLGQDRDYPTINMKDNVRLAIRNTQRQRHRAISREIASAGIVILKNTPGKKGLPLVKPTTIALFGPAAGPNPYGPNQYAYGTGLDPYQRDIFDSYTHGEFGIGNGQGTLAGGGGSGSVFYPRLADPLAAISRKADEDLTLVDWTTTTNLTFASYIAKRGSVCLPVVSSFSGEMQDRNLSLLHNGDELIKTVADNCANTIPIIQSVGPVDLENWIDHPNVTAVVWANLGGQELGPALVDVLYGKVNPSGRLIYTIARNESDYAQPRIVKEPEPYPQINYTEGVSIDYRGFEKNKVEPRFWFGHGLSYSNFTYTGLQVLKHSDIDEAIKTPIKYVADAPGGDARLFDLAVSLSFDIHNDGPFDGTEIAQIYLQLPEEAQNPTKILRGFENVHIRDGETQKVWMHLRRKDISYWSVINQTWVAPSGEFGVFVGASSNDIRLKGSFTL